MRGILIIVVLFVALPAAAQTEGSANSRGCAYIDHFKDLGNTKIDTIRVGRRIVDPIDDSASFEKKAFGFVVKEGKIYKKSKTHRRCDGKFIDIEYYQDFSDRIDLSST